MNGQQFLRRVEQRQLVAPQVIESLRAEIARQRRPVSAAMIAKHLVDYGYLTALQARQLIGGERIKARPAVAGEPGLAELTPASSRGAGSSAGEQIDEADLELAPLPSDRAKLDSPPVEFSDALDPFADPLARVLAEAKDPYAPEGDPLPPLAGPVPLRVLVPVVFLAAAIFVLLAGLALSR